MSVALRRVHPSRPPTPEPATSPVAHCSTLWQAVPTRVLRLLETSGWEEDALLLVTSTDLSVPGDSQKQWLAVTHEQLAVVTDGEKPELIRDLAIERVQSFRTHAAVGAGFLQALVDGMWVDVMRYSNSLADRFGKVVRKLDDLRANGKLTIHAADEIDRRHCAKCGLALQFVGDVCPRCIPRGAIVGRTWQLLRPYRLATLALCGLMTLGLMAELVPPKLQQYLVDHVLEMDRPARKMQELLASLAVIVFGLALARLVAAAVAALKGILSSRVGTALTFDLRSRMVQKLQQLSVDYYDRHQVGVLMNRVAYDTEALHGLIQQFTGGFLLQILQLLGVGVMLFTLNSKLALLTLIPMPLVLGGSWFFWNYVYPQYYRYWDSNSKQAGALTSMLAGIRVVKAFTQEEREFERFSRSSGYLRSSRLGVELSTATFSSVMQLIFSLGGLIVWFVGGRDVLGQQMTLGALMAFLAYLAMFYTPFSNLAQLTAWLTSFMTASQRIFELLDTPLGINDPETPQRVEQIEGRIRFEGVTFGYDRHQPVLKNVHLEIRPGEMIGVVGRSGSGKTTLVNLICRFYDVDEGRVTIDGLDVRDFAPQDLRRHVGVVLQEPFLFRGTVWENVVYGQPDATPEEAIRACKAGNAHDFILRLPLGYDTSLGERGAGLSGGEKQRVSIARALLYDPKILILDEATSNVDTESEQAIQDALKVLVRGRTTIAIAHRLSTLRDAHRILVFDQGKLVEQGPHGELLRQDGLYAKLVRIQTQLTSEPTVDRLVLDDTNGASATNTSAGSARSSREHGTSGRNTSGQEPDGAEGNLGTAAFEAVWLTPANAAVFIGDHDSLHVALAGQPARGGIFVVRSFPAGRPDEFISLRYADCEGRDHEMGLVRRIADWPVEVQLLLHEALLRRYHIHTIESIESIELEYGLLTFRVQTDRGPSQFMMRWSQSQAQDYAKSGKLLLDVDDNRYLVPDVESLPRRQQMLFRRYVYW